jgi:class 3 adenylate cyclase/tetratricopeptide (TPR) repeat protein
MNAAAMALGGTGSELALEGERKQVTVLFADVTGSMELSEGSDPEVWRQTMNRFFAILCDGVQRFEGTVDKFTGDGICALFGAPVAHEDHALRACHAALYLQRELDAYALELHRTQGLSFSVRIGLHSGEVVAAAIGEDLGREYTAFGHAVGLARRIEQLAEPGRVYVSEDTAWLAAGHFAMTDLGEFWVRGASRALRVHELIGIGTAGGRLDVAGARGFSRFVGRDAELRMLERAFDGQGQVVGIVGEAGVGKSRLCHEFAERARQQGIPVYHLAGQAHARTVPLLPVLGFLRDYFEIGEHDTDETARERIAGKLALLDEEFADDLGVLFDFLAVPDPQHGLGQMDPDARQRRLLGLMKRLTRAESRRAPGVTIVEDLHWLDPASEAFVANQVEAVQGTRSLVVLNFRSDYHAPWLSRSYYRPIALAPLGAVAIEQLLGELLGPDRSLAGLTGLVRERTQGNPFFIEELVHSLVESGSLEGQRGAYRLVAPVEQAAVPASVHAVLAARIDRLGWREKTVLQAAAVIGREFAGAILERVLDFAPTELDAALRRLVADEFIFEQELYPEACSAFKHPLTREVAYGTQLSERRAPVHALVARAIAAQHPERLDERAALIAQHWEAAGEPLEAARWHARAGAWAGANDPTRALGHWRKVRELTDPLPASPETTALGLEARFSWLNCGWRLGISDKEAETVFWEADRIASQTGDVRSRALLLAVYGAIRGVGGGEVREWARLARQAVALAEESGDTALRIAIAPAAVAFYRTGEFRESLAICDRAIELAEGDAEMGTGFGVGCPYAFCLGLKGLNLLELGELEQAGRLLERGGSLARRQGDDQTLGYTTMWSAWLAYFAGEPSSLLAHAEQAVETAERIGDPFSRACAWFFIGLAERVRGEWRPAIEALERSAAIAREGRTGADRDPYRLALLGESYLGLGDAARARSLVEEGLALARARGDRFYEAHASLALARVRRASGGADARGQAQAALARALDLARLTGSKALEPLVHAELAELADRSGDRDGAECELREAHRLFTEIGATSRAERVAAELATRPG